MNESFVFYASYHEAIQCLPKDIQSEAYKSICEYAITGKEPEEANPIVKAIFKMAKPTVESNLARREKGKLGGAPKGNKNAKKKDKNNLNNHRLISKQPNENETEAVNGTVNENVNETSSPAPRGNQEGSDNIKIYISPDYHVAWDDNFQTELRNLSEDQIGEIDYWLQKKFECQQIPAHIIRNALITKAKRENK